jgi:hypothetical protein
VAIEHIWRIGEDTGGNRMHWMQSCKTEAEAINIQEELAKIHSGKKIGRQRQRVRDGRPLNLDLVIYWIEWDGNDFIQTK